MTSRRDGNCLTASKQDACSAQPVRAATRLMEGNGRGEAVTSRRYGNCLTASKQGADMAQEIVSRHKHNMLSLLYATCLKLLVFYLRSISILSSRLYPHLPGDLNISGFSTNTMYVFLFYRSCATRPGHLTSSIC